MTPLEAARQLGIDVDGLSPVQVDQAVKAEADRRRPRVTVTRPRVGMDGESFVASVSVAGGLTPRTTSLQAAAAVLSAYGQTRDQAASKRKRSVQNVAPWQNEAWALLDEVGELWFAGSWMSAALSRVRLVAAKMSTNGEEPKVLGGAGPTARYQPDGQRIRVSDEDAPPDKPQETEDDRTVADLVARWSGGPAGQEQVLGRVGWHLNIAGETYIVARSDRPKPTVPGADSRTTPGVPAGQRLTPQGVLAPVDLPEAGGYTDAGGMEDLIWAAYSREEISEKDGVWSVSDGGEPFELPEAESLVIRCWRPHPKKFRQAASAVLPCLPILRELRGLTMHVGAQIDSRLAGAGLLLLPQSMTFPGSAADSEVVDGADPFITMLMEAMVTPIKDRDSAAAVVPVVIKVPDESIGKAQHIKFHDAGLDKVAKELREEAIHRLALSLDLPQEVVTGLGQTNHWSAWQIDESAIKMHVAPVAATFCHSLTVGWLRPTLEAMGIADADDYLVWFDTTPLVLRPDRSTQAMELYDRAVIGSMALRREAGFAETDAPSEGERREQILVRVAERAPTTAPVILPLLGIEMPKPVIDQAADTVLAISGGDANVTDPIRDARKITADERRNITERQGASGKTPNRAETDKTSRGVAASVTPAVCEIDAAQLEACHLAVLHALQYAGKRMAFGSRSEQSQLRPLVAAHPYRMHMQVSCAGRDVDKLLDGAWATLAVARGDGDLLVPILDTYVRQLMEHQVEHSKDYLRTALQQAGVCVDL